VWGVGFWWGYPSRTTAIVCLRSCPPLLPDALFPLTIMTIGSLFSGIGGLDLGLERAGHEVVWQVEADAYCRRVLAKHWPHVPCYEDVTTVRGEDLPPVDLICGGFPCQAVSVAGKQIGTQDDRWLWPHFARLLRVLRPRYALLENVPGLLTVSGGRVFGAVLSDLAESGYDCEWEVLSAADVGAPHLRQRVWIVADARRQRLEGVSPVGATPPSTGRTGGESGAGPPRFFDAPRRGDWQPEPNIRRVAPRLPDRMDRLRCLGNSVVPQVAEWMGRRLTAYAETREG
jgi:DNA (cytosine-5)-methyltransferase 1